MNVINLTPHEINICNASGTTIKTVEPSGQIARISESRESLQSIDGIPVSRASYGKPENLPEPQEDTIYIVSGLMLAHVHSRNDVYAPGPAVRDENGRIIGCIGLSAPAVKRQISFDVYDAHNATDIAIDLTRQNADFTVDKHMTFCINI